jgi:hypothetical protein
LRLGMYLVSPRVSLEMSRLEASGRPGSAYWQLYLSYRDL